MAIPDTQENREIFYEELKIILKAYFCWDDTKTNAEIEEMKKEGSIEAMLLS